MIKWTIYITPDGFGNSLLQNCNDYNYLIIDSRNSHYFVHQSNTIINHHLVTPFSRSDNSPCVQSASPLAPAIGTLGSEAHISSFRLYNAPYLSIINSATTYTHWICKCTCCEQGWVEGMNPEYFHSYIITFSKGSPHHRIHLRKQEFPDYSAESDQNCDV